MKRIRVRGALGCALLASAALGCSRGQSSAQPPSQLPPEAEAASPILPVSLATLGADTEFVAGVSLAALRETAVWDKLGERVLAAFEFSFVHALSREACGFDPLVEVDRLLIAGDSDDPDGTLVAVDGLSRSQLRACVEGLARLASEQASIHDETPISRYGIGADSISLGWTGDHTFITLIGGDAALLERRLAGDGGLDAGTPVSTLLDAQIEGSESAWIVAAPRPGTPLAREIEDTEFEPLGLSATIVAGDGLAFAGSVHLATAGDAQRVHAQVVEAIDVLQSLPGELGMLGQRLQAAVVNEDIRLTLELPAEDIELLASQLLGAPAEQVLPAPPEDAGDPDLELPAPHHLETYTADLEGEGPLTATLQTSMGTIRCRLFEDEAPATVANFVGLARGLHPWRHPESGDLMNEPLYDGTIFHRVIPEFMIQGGDPLGTGTGGPGYRFATEVSGELRHNRPGILSMANAGPHTNGSQFFITEGAHPHLDGGYNVFGLCEDLDVVSAIARVETDDQALSRPLDDVVIEKVLIHRGAR